MNNFQQEYFCLKSNIYKDYLETAGRTGSYYLSKVENETFTTVQLIDYFGDDELETISSFYKEFGVLVIVEKNSYNYFKYKYKSRNFILNHCEIETFKHHHTEFKHIIIGEFLSISRFLMAVVHDSESTGLCQKYQPYAVYIDSNKETFKITKIENDSLPYNDITPFVRQLTCVDFDLNLLMDAGCYVYCDDSNHYIKTAKKTLTYFIPILNFQNFIKGNCVIVGNPFSILNLLSNSEGFLNNEIIAAIKNLVCEEYNDLEEFISPYRKDEKEVQLEQIIYNFL